MYGFGQIGRQFLRISLQQGLSISDIRDEATLAALFAVDTNYGHWPEPVAGTAGKLIVGKQGQLLSVASWHDNE